MVTAAIDSPYIKGDRKHGPIQFADRVRPGFTRKDLARLFAARGYTKGAEIGVADGRYSLTLCEAIPNLELLCVDPWRAYAGNNRGGPQSQHDGNLERAKHRLAPYNVRLQRGLSMDVVGDVPLDSLDFVFIDGHHSYEYVRDDLREWSKRVRSGGTVSGHDFYEFKWAGVVEAVVEYTTAHGITDWSICDEREPSFFWVKP
jgi:predicted O-methyltransferase YrrM